MGDRCGFFNRMNCSVWVERSDWSIRFRTDPMISCDTKQQFCRVACGCGRPVDPRGGGSDDEEDSDDDEDDDGVHVSARPTDKLHQTTQFICSAGLGSPPRGRTAFTTLACWRVRSNSRRNEMPR